MFFQPFPVLMQAGVLGPVTTDLVIEGVTFTEAADANDCVMFDFGLTTATTFDPSKGAASAFGRVRQNDANAAGIHVEAVAVYGISVDTNAAAATGKVRVIGRCTPLCASHTNARGQMYRPTPGADTLTLVAVPGGTVGATGLLRKIVAVSESAAGASTTLPTVFFNGIGLGFSLHDS